MSAIDRVMPGVRYADLGDIRMAYREVGPRQGVPVIFCHGFPELAFSWRHQLKAFGRRGALGDRPGPARLWPDRRPEAVEAYDIEHLTDDVIGLLDHLGVEKAIFCGHDWGGIVVWQMPLRYPDRIAGVIGLNTPFIPPARRWTPSPSCAAAWASEMYIVHFQTPGRGRRRAASDSPAPWTSSCAARLRARRRRAAASAHRAQARRGRSPTFALTDALEA